MERYRLNDYFEDWQDLTQDGGIFQFLQRLNVPWKNENFEKSLDMMYHGGFSGSKYASPFLERLAGTAPATAGVKTMIATSLFAVYGTNWTKQWETLSFEYDPIENYSMTEEMTNDRTIKNYGKSVTRIDNLTHGKTGTDTTTTNGTDTRTDNLTHGKTGTDTTATNGTNTRTDNLSKVDAPNLTTNTDTDTYGFNSASAVPADKQEVRETGQRTETNTGTQTTATNGTDATTYNTTETDSGTQTTATNGTDATTYNTTETETGTQTLSDGGSDTETHSYQLTRAGNIGVTTSQQMIQSEREVWLWNFFINVVFPDLDEALTLKIY